MAEQSKVTSIEDFLDQHGPDALNASADEPRRDSFEVLPDSASPDEVKETSPQSPGGDPDSSESSNLEDSELDEATLQALGLVPSEQPAPKGDNDESTGTEQQQVDLAQLASVLGLGEGDLSQGEDGKIHLKTKVDGQSEGVSLEELRKGYQLQSHFTRQQEQFLQEKQQWEEARQQQARSLEQQAALATEVLTAEEAALNQRYTKDWEALRNEDPAEYAAQVAEYNQQLNTLRQRQQNLAQTIQQRQQEQMQQHQQQMQQQWAQNAQLVAEAQGWDNAEKWKEGTERLRNYLVENHGYTEDDMRLFVDPRAIAISEKARRYDEMVKRIETARKKVKESHKMPAGTAPGQTGGSKKRKLDAAKANLKKNPNSSDAAAAVFDQLGVL